MSDTIYVQVGSAGLGRDGDEYVITITKPGQFIISNCLETTYTAIKEYNLDDWFSRFIEPGYTKSSHLSTTDKKDLESIIKSDPDNYLAKHLLKLVSETLRCCLNPCIDIDAPVKGN
jgi:hypothetical protein